MSRRVISRPLNAAAAVPPATPDDFLARLVKYIPAEIVGLYLAVRGFIPADQPPSFFWVIAGVSWILVPIYFWIATTRGGTPPMKLQILLATIAFPIWVFAVGGPPVTSWPWFVAHSYVASIALVIATVVFGWIEPPPGS
jgi:hypothetical protein